MISAGTGVLNLFCGESWIAFELALRDQMRSQLCGFFLVCWVVLLNEKATGCGLKMLNFLQQSARSADFLCLTHHRVSSPFSLSLPSCGRGSARLCSRLGPPHPGFLSLILACLPFDVPSRLFLPFCFSLRSSSRDLGLVFAWWEETAWEWSEAAGGEGSGGAETSARDEILGCWQCQVCCMPVVCTTNGLSLSPLIVCG